MGIRLTFSEYLDSKKTLREAIKKTPQRLMKYNVKRHCKLMVENSDGKQYLSLNPGQIINVTWLYEDKHNPIPLRIFFTDVKRISEDERFYTSWSGEKLSKWLTKNSKGK